MTSQFTAQSNNPSPTTPTTNTNTNTNTTNTTTTCSSLPPLLQHSGSVVVVSDPLPSYLKDGPSSDASGFLPSESGSSLSGYLPAALNCSDSDRLVAMRVRLHAKRKSATAGIFLCPAVKVLQLQVRGHEGQFLHVPLKVRVTSCSRTNDSWVLRKGCHRSRVTLRFTVDLFSPTPQELTYSYSVHTDRVLNKTTAHKSERPRRPYHWPDRHSIERAVRWKRSAVDHEATWSPLLNSTLFVEATLGVGGSSIECGQSQTCVRYGWEGCDHLTCDFMLSYRVLDNTMADIEISARGPGWVAVGFSSDKFMGGDDDVIGCRQKRKLSAEVVPMSLGNTVKHTRPHEKANRLQLMTGLLHNQHIYCRVRRPLKYKERLANSDLDLFNDWHQLYAFGDIDSTGRILQHTELPRVSEHKISMIRVTDIMVVTSAASSLPLPTSCLLVFLLQLLLVFAGS
ncbi:hypothetical protein ACOMHN_047650 [Nucella lapillus]